MHNALIATDIISLGGDYGLEWGGRSVQMNSSIRAENKKQHSWRDAATSTPPQGLAKYKPVPAH